MNLEQQIQTLVFSFIYGMFFSSIFNVLYFSIVQSKFYIKVLINICISIVFSIFYFSILLKINHGIIIVKLSYLCIRKYVIMAYTNLYLIRIEQV